MRQTELQRRKSWRTWGSTSRLHPADDASPKRHRLVRIRIMIQNDVLIHSHGFANPCKNGDQWKNDWNNKARYLRDPKWSNLPTNVIEKRALLSLDGHVDQRHVGVVKQVEILQIAEIQSLEHHALPFQLQVSAYVLHVLADRVGREDGEWWLKSERDIVNNPIWGRCITIMAFSPSITQSTRYLLRMQLFVRRAWCRRFEWRRRPSFLPWAESGSNFQRGNPWCRLFGEGRMWKQVIQWSKQEKNTDCPNPPNAMPTFDQGER